MCDFLSFLRLTRSEYEGADPSRQDAQRGAVYVLTYLGLGFVEESDFLERILDGSHEVKNMHRTQTSSLWVPP